MEYKGGANSRRNLETSDMQNINVYDTGAPGNAFIHYHHEMTYVSKSVKNKGTKAITMLLDNTIKNNNFKKLLNNKERISCVMLPFVTLQKAINNSK